MKDRINRKRKSHLLNAEVLLTIIGIIMVVLMIICYILMKTDLNEISQNGQLTIADIQKENLKFVYNVITIFIFGMAGIISLLTYINSIKKQVERDRELAENRLEAALETDEYVTWEYDTVEDKLLRVGYEGGLIDSDEKEIDNPLEYITKNELLEPEDREKLIVFIKSFFGKEKKSEVILKSKNKKKDITWIKLCGRKVFDDNGNVLSVIGKSIDVTEEKIKEIEEGGKLERDTRTGLLNAESFKKRIEEKIKSETGAAIHAMFYLDIDEFNEIRDKFGKIYTDAMMIHIANQLRSIFTPGDYIARLGKDSFGIFVTNMKTVADAEKKAEDVMDIFHKGFGFKLNYYNVSASLGMAVYPEDANFYDKLFEKSAIALYVAKDHGKAQFTKYSESMDKFSSAARKYSEYKPVNNLEERNSIVNAEIISDTIDILFDSNYSGYAIDTLLSVVGTLLEINHLIIFEVSDDKKWIDATHEWAQRNELLLEEKISHMSYEKHKKGMLFLKNLNHRFVSENDGDVYVPEYFANENTTKLRRIIQFGIYDKDEFVGYLSALSYEKGKGWSKMVIDTLAMVTKIVGESIIRDRTLRKSILTSQRDQLTNTYNFNAFLNETNRVHIENREKKYAIMYIDVNQFKLINETYGYSAGDFILIEMGRMINRECGEGAIVSRVTGDKFLACVEYQDEQNINEIADRISESGKKIEDDTGAVYKLTIVIGTYVMQNGDSAIMAVDKANIARKNAQRKHILYSLYQDEMHNEIAEEKEIEDVMEEALVAREFKVYYQPKYNLTTGRVYGCEALSRWDRKGKGIVNPSAYIPVFEKNGFIKKLDYYVFEEACALVRNLMDDKKEVYPISVNFSRIHFNNDQLPEFLLETVKKYRVKPESFEIEITETALRQVDEHFRSVLSKIKEYGFSISVDDFGSGLSALNMLSDFKFDVLKIDKDFFHNQSTTEREKIVISSIAEMAEKLGMELICEGVETETQADFLESVGCHHAQGFLFSRPLPVGEFLRLVYNVDFKKPQ